MPNVSEALIARFLADYLGWWSEGRERPAVGQRARVGIEA
jgi:hypothetical protein